MTIPQATVVEVPKDVWYDKITKSFGFSIQFDGLVEPTLKAYYILGDSLLGYIQYALEDRGQNPRYFLRHGIQG